MKGKGVNKIMGLVVFGVWGFLVFKVYNVYFKIPHNNIEDMPAALNVEHKAVDKSTPELQLNYPDPFLKNRLVMRLL